MAESKDVVPEFTVEPIDEIRRLTRRHSTAKHLADGYWSVVYGELCNPGRENRLVLNEWLYAASRATVFQDACRVELGDAYVREGLGL